MQIVDNFGYIYLCKDNPSEYYEGLIGEIWVNSRPVLLKEYYRSYYENNYNYAICFIKIDSRQVSLTIRISPNYMVSAIITTTRGDVFHYLYTNIKYMDLSLIFDLLTLLDFDNADNITPEIDILRGKIQSSFRLMTNIRFDAINRSSIAFIDLRLLKSNCCYYHKFNNSCIYFHYHSYRKVKLVIIIDNKIEYKLNAAYVKGELDYTVTPTHRFEQVTIADITHICKLLSNYQLTGKGINNLNLRDGLYWKISKFLCRTWTNLIAHRSFQIEKLIVTNYVY